MNHEKVRKVIGEILKQDGVPVDEVTYVEFTADYIKDAREGRTLRESGGYANVSFRADSLVASENTKMDYHYEKLSAFLKFFAGKPVHKKPGHIFRKTIKHSRIIIWLLEMADV